MPQHRVKDFLGQKIGRLLVLERLPEWRASAGYMWLCRCDCGNETITAASNLGAQRGLQCKTCGIAEQRAKIKAGYRKTGAKQPRHGLRAGGKAEPLYRVWCGMTARCRPTAKNINRTYILNGIKVCDAWLDYPTFRAWALSTGYVHYADKPLHDRLALDRIDALGNYCPENCRWITGRENSRLTKHKKPNVAAAQGVH